MRHDDRRSPEAAAYRKLYKGARWQQLRQAQLTAHPLCARCLRMAPRKLTPATVVHHVREHKGDLVLFFDPANLESSCKPHHDGDAQSEERVGYSRQIGVDGWPVDPSHPVNATALVRRWGYSIPHGVLPSAIPVHLVCGAPGSGKTTYVRAHAKPSDVIIDMDDIRQRLGFRRYSGDWRHLRRAMQERDRLIRSLASRTVGEAWLIVGAPTDRERQQWASALGNVVLHEIDTDARECMRRIDNDPTREGEKQRLMVAVDRYFARRMSEVGGRIEKNINALQDRRGSAKSRICFSGITEALTTHGQTTNAARRS